MIHASFTILSTENVSSPAGNILIPPAEVVIPVRAIFIMSAFVFLVNLRRIIRGGNNQQDERIEIRLRTCSSPTPFNNSLHFYRAFANNYPCHSVGLQVKVNGRSNQNATAVIRSCLYQSHYQYIVNFDSNIFILSADNISMTQGIPMYKY